MEHHVPVLALQSCILHFLSISGLEIFSQRLFGMTAKSCSLTQFTSRCWWPPPQLTEHYKVIHTGLKFSLHLWLITTASLIFVNKKNHVWLTLSQSSAFHWVQGFRLHCSVLFGLSMVLQRWGAGQYTSRSRMPSPQLPEHWGKHKDLREVSVFRWELE